MTDPDAPLDIRAPGLTDVLGDADALSLWELMRRARTPVESSALATASGLPLDQVHDCLDRLAEAGLAEAVKATARRRTPRWRVTREVIIAGYRLGDPLDEVLIRCVDDLFGPERQRQIQSCAAGPADGDGAGGAWSRVWAGRLAREDLHAFWGLMQEFSRLCHASTARFLGSPPSREQMCTHHLEIRLEPLEPGVPRLPSIAMQPLDAEGRPHREVEAWVLGTPRSAPPARDCRGGLGEREFEVACLIAAGRSRTEIADRLGIAASTVASHARAIYRKLGVRSRRDLREHLGGSGRTAGGAAAVPAIPPSDRCGGDPPEPIDLRATGVAAALRSMEALAVWEHLRQQTQPAAASEVAESFGWDGPAVDAALATLAAAGDRLVEKLPPRGRGGTVRWRAACDSIVVSHRIGDAKDEWLLAPLVRAYGEVRRRAIRARAKSFETRGPTEMIHLGMHSVAFNAEELRRAAEILGELERIRRRSDAQHDEAGDSTPWSNYHLSVEVTPLRPGILPQPTMQVVGMAWASEMAKSLADRVASLSRRERTVALSLRDGLDRRRIAESLGVSTNTVATLAKRLYAKLGVRSRTELAKRLGM
jgi:DNA-binding NarL/FixJ family response regulator/predicted transcriptional regulator